MDGLRVGILVSGFVDGRCERDGDSTLGSTLGSAVGRLDRLEEKEVGAEEVRIMLFNGATVGPLLDVKVEVTLLVVGAEEIEVGRKDG